MDLRFVSRNKDKIDEADKILGLHGIKVVPYLIAIEELQTTDVSKLVNDKVMKAYEMVGRPLFVEHTSLHLEYLGGLPGGLTQIFWDALEADKFADLFGHRSPNRRVVARTVVAYCDGRRIHSFEGEISGDIMAKPAGPREFQWDCVFRADGQSKTFAELGLAKNDISMRRIALEKLAHLLKSSAVP